VSEEARDDLVDVRLYFDQREAIAALGAIRAHGIDGWIAEPETLDEAPFTMADAPYRLRVPPDQVERVDHILGERVAGGPEPPPEEMGVERELPPEPPSTDVAAALATLRARRTASWIVWGLTAVLLVAATSAGTLGGFVLGSGALVASAVVHGIVLRTPCPRCGRPFQARRFGFNLFTRECLHCGLPIDAASRDS
jgi:hypothetical protein